MSDKSLESHCKTFIPYPKAENILRSRFDGITREEIALWLANGDMTAKQSEFANAEEVIFRHRLGIAQIKGVNRDGMMPNLEELLFPLYFSERELMEINPKRWRPYAYLKAWGETRGMDEKLLKALITQYIGCIHDPTPRSYQDVEMAIIEDEMKRGMYHSDWLTIIEDEYLNQAETINVANESNASHTGESLEVSTEDADQANNDRADQNTSRKQAEETTQACGGAVVDGIQDKESTVSVLGLSQQYNLPVSTAEALFKILSKALEQGIDLLPGLFNA